MRLDWPVNFRLADRKEVFMLLLSAELSNAFVVALGIGVVFVGLVCLILICMVMGKICNSLFNQKKAAPAPAAPAAPAPAAIPNRQEFVAAVAAAIAEDMGTDVSRIRIHSIKKL